MSVQKAIRFPDELVARAQAVADAEDRSFSYVVVRALEGHLSNPAMWGDPSLPAGSAARRRSVYEVPSHPVSEKEARATANVAESTGAESRLFRCRSCEFSARSPRARCPRHGGALVQV